MDKPTFLDILQHIVEGFEDPTFQKDFGATKGSGDVGQMMALPLAIQERAFGRHGLDAAGGTAAFKEAGRSFGLDSEAAPLLARMKAALK
ncbi:MAG: hypothetical protein EXR79_17550 [Myxococcales bacterium]|nr:hypothetical protein [Myxococcales bacterium]